MNEVVLVRGMLFLHIIQIEGESTLIIFFCKTLHPRPFYPRSLTVERPHCWTLWWFSQHYQSHRILHAIFYLVYWQKGKTQAKCSQKHLLKQCYSAVSFSIFQLLYFTQLLNAILLIVSLYSVILDVLIFKLYCNLGLQFLIMPSKVTEVARCLIYQSSCFQ